MDPQLQAIELVCERLYNATSEAERAEAQRQVLTLSSSTEYIPQCRAVLDHSRSVYALHVAASALTRVVTVHWNSFAASTRLEVRSFALEYLSAHGPALLAPERGAAFVVTALVQLLARVTKLGWFDDAAFREIVDDVSKFVHASAEHCAVAMRILRQVWSLV